MTVRAVRKMAHHVRDIRGTADEEITDEGLWRLAQQENRLLITTDKGFSLHRNEPHNGILIVRLRKPNRHKIHQRVMLAMQQFDEGQWPGLLVVMRDQVQSTWTSTRRE